MRWFTVEPPQSNICSMGTSAKRTVRKRSAWYGYGARALQRVFPNAVYCYVCPICRRGFTPPALEMDLLSIEHVPPKRLGGKPLVLTCRRCNTSAGATLDSAMASVEDFHDFAAGTMCKPTRARLTVEEAALHIEVRAENNGISLTAPPKANRKEDIEAMEKVYNRNSSKRPSLQISLHRRVRYEDSLVGWLRAAYLTAFAALGYRYVLWDELDLIRNQLADPASQLVRVFGVTMPTEPPDRRRILLVEEPSWLGSLAIQIGRHVTFLPWSLRADELYGNLAARAGQSASNEIVGMFVPWPTHPEHALDFMPEAR